MTGIGQDGDIANCCAQIAQISRAFVLVRNSYNILATRLEFGMQSAEEYKQARPRRHSHHIKVIRSGSICRWSPSLLYLCDNTKLLLPKRAASNNTIRQILSVFRSLHVTMSCYRLPLIAAPIEDRIIQLCRSIPVIKASYNKIDHLRFTVLRSKRKG